MTMPFQRIISHICQVWGIFCKWTVKPRLMEKTSGLNWSGDCALKGQIPRTKRAFSETIIPIVDLTVMFVVGVTFVTVLAVTHVNAHCTLVSWSLFFIGVMWNAHKCSSAHLDDVDWDGIPTAKNWFRNFGSSRMVFIVISFQKLMWTQVESVQHSHSSFLQWTRRCPMCPDVFPFPSSPLGALTQNEVLSSVTEKLTSHHHFPCVVEVPQQVLQLANLGRDACPSFQDFIHHGKDGNPAWSKKSWGNARRFLERFINNQRSIWKIWDLGMTRPFHMPC